MHTTNNAYRMGSTTCMFLYIWGCVSITMGVSPSCSTIVDCHLGEASAELTAEINHLLGCECINNPDCVCIAPCNEQLCTDARAIAFLKTPFSGTCTTGARELASALRESCARAECCPTTVCSANFFAYTRKNCNAVLSRTEVGLFTAYTVVCIITFIINYRSSTQLILASITPIAQKRRTRKQRKQP